MEKRAAEGGLENPKHTVSSKAIHDAFKVKLPAMISKGNAGAWSAR